MAMEAGGYAEKLGNRYEANWVAYQLLRLLDEKIASVTIEPLGNDEVGTDVIVENSDTSLEHHQCKVGAGDAEHWSVALLYEKGILKNAFEQIERGKREFYVISPLPSKQMSDLKDSSRNSPEDVNQYYEHQISKSKTRKKDFDYICDKLGLNTNNELHLDSARQFLAKFHVFAYTIDTHSNEQLNDYANKLFVGNSVKLVSFLKHYADNDDKLRTKITAHDLFQDLQKSGFKAKVLEADDRISPIINNLNTNFEQSITPYLIANTNIHRPELDELIQSTQSHAITLLMAEAGMGKSALLLELKNDLELQGAIVVPIRLDRCKVETSADAFGQALGFSYTPTYSLAKYALNNKIVLVLDQLDAIRWTAAHSDNALHVCQEIVRQVLTLRNSNVDISIVFASRDFDISEDVALNAWLSSINDELNTVKLSSLSEETVKELVQPYEKYETLSAEQQDTLKIPLWLGIYISIALSEKCAPDFTNKLELVKRYWDNRVLEANKITDPNQNLLVINELLHQMISKSKFSVSETSLHNISLTALSALLSVGLITKQNKQISFSHQALFDYQVGVRLFIAAQDSFDKLLEEIGDFSQQTLTRREHLKYAMSMLLTESQKDFCNIVSSLLQSKNIRFHLKYLLFNSLKEIKNFKAPAKNLVDSIVKSPELLPHLLSSTCYSNPELVHYLSEQGALNAWLDNATDEELVSKLLRILRSIADQKPDVVLKTVVPYIGISQEWNNRVYESLCWDIENDSDDMFEIRKQLLTAGVSAHFIHWKTLAKKTPIRTLDLIEMLLKHYKEVLGTKKYMSRDKVDAISHRDIFTKSDLEGIEKISHQIPFEALNRLLNIVHSIVRDIDDEQIHEAWLCQDRQSNYDAVESITHCVFSVIEQAAKRLKDQPEKLAEAIATHLNSASPVLNHLIAKVLKYYPTSEADTVVSWLLYTPKKRLNCGNTYIEAEWKLPGELIEKFSPHCSEYLFLQLEEKIYNYTQNRSIDDYKWRLECRRKGIYYSYWGEPQYFLLPKLSQSRRSEKSNQLIGVLNRKFIEYTERDFCRAFHLRRSGGMVTSPLPLGNVLSNLTWTKLILTPKERTNRKTWRQAGKQVVHESSVEQFARSLETAVINEPERFASLALTLPPNIDSDYIEWIYYGLSNTDKNRVSEQYRSGWQLCPVELIEKVINHFGYEGYEYQIVRIFDRRIAEDGWSNKIIDLLVKLSKTAKDPEPEKLNVIVNNEPNVVEDVLVRTLASNAINCCRGIAFSAIGHLYWKSEKLASELINSLDDVINDPHPAVNYSASELLLPIYNYNRQLAHQKFLALCNKDLRMSCIRGNHYFFNDGFTEDSSFREQYLNLTLRMKCSPFDEVKKEAGRQIAARWFFYELFSEQIHTLKKWDTQLKSGATSVISQFLTESRYNSTIKKLLPLYEVLSNDDDKLILEKIGRSVSNKNYWSRTDTAAFFSVLANAKAALYNLWQIFHYLDENKVNLVSISNELLQLVKNIVNSDAIDKNQRAMNIRDSDLIKVLQRLYEEAGDDENDEVINQCLDIWDLLLKNQVYSAINATTKLSTGMLG
ncbi:MULTISPECIES: ATP-binding protein [unclassified Aeromonas]|uniref:ATP-binding protein n=1 Tax=unclassified Aeromonas TaxID=257493 RepID=UPI00084AA293|nr:MULTISPECIES: ATP-binding protein [unclassified Aeromonas]OEC51500.1 hypothetical protein A9G04_18530 [Aeromonas sp. ANNP30]OEC63113.1 hypothetical protein A9G49_16710 [Aeromonas sp. ANP5]